MKVLSRRVRPWSAAPAATVAWKTAADVAGKLVTLAITVAAARALPTDEFGVLALAMTTGWLLGVATDAGLSMHVAREAARAGTAVEGVWRRSITLRSIAAICALFPAAGVAWVVTPAALALPFLVVVAAQLAGAVAETVYHLFRGLGRTNLEATVHATTRMAAGVFAGAALARDPHLDLLAVALVVPPVVAIAWSMAWARRLLRAAEPLSSPHGLDWRVFLSEVAPIGAGAMVSALYFRCDLFFLEWWHGLDTVAGYNAAFRLVEATRVFPAAALAVVFPWLVRARTLAPLGGIGGAMGVTGVLAGGITVAVSPLAIAVVYGGRYPDAVPMLRVLALAVPLFFVNYALTHQVIAWNGQRAYLAIALAALIANVTANLALVPAYGGLGAAWATIATETIVASGCLIVLAGARPVVQGGLVAEAPR
jgi:O-antigen/teichoic acid export membrane protein